MWIGCWLLDIPDPRGRTYGMCLCGVPTLRWSEMTQLEGRASILAQRGRVISMLSFGLSVCVLPCIYNAYRISLVWA